MKISLQWLHEYVDIQEYFEKPEALAEILTRAGLEVEDLIQQGKNFHHVVVGHILEKGLHPNSDKLSLCQVSTGKEIHQIVCGAQNHRTGDKVIVALPGAVLPGNFAIKKAQVRGVDSAGMLCSLKELGLSEASEGIALLPSEAPVGQDYALYSGCNDVILELKVTPNRADCLSHWGLAREVSCLLGRPLKFPQIMETQNSGKALKKITVKSSQLCGRYMGASLGGVKVQESPPWLRRRLESVGLSSINNVVDVTNFVMMELGQPLHAFDADKLKGDEVLIAEAASGELFTTLDGSSKKLMGEELTIRDSQGVLCLAGVMGGKDSGVSESTQNLFLEAAFFEGFGVRKTARLHGLETDSAYRFARGVDPELTQKALQRALHLLMEVSGAQVLCEVQDVYPQPRVLKAVKLSAQMVSARLGYDFSESLMTEWMGRLGCSTKKLGDGFYEFTPPSFRFDLETEMDLVEECSRLHGYEHIPESIPPLREPPALNDKGFLLDQKTSRILRAQGYQQALNFAFNSQSKEAAFLGTPEAWKSTGLSLDGDFVEIQNPLNEEMDQMRSSLSPGLFRNLVLNVHRGNSVGRLFEMGSVFSWKDEEVQEVSRLGGVAWGQKSGLWEKDPGAERPLIYEVKGALEFLLRELQISAFTWTSVEKSFAPSFLHGGQFSVLVVEGKKVGYLGTLHPLYRDREKIRVPVVHFELNLSLLYQGQPRSQRYQPLSYYPSMERDLALKVSDKISAGDILKEMKKSAGSLLVQTEVLDVYKGDKVGAGFKGLTIRCFYQDRKATLQEAQVQDCQNKILGDLEKKWNVVLRT